MWQLILESYWHLLQVAMIMNSRNSMKALHHVVSNQPISQRVHRKRRELSTLCRAMNLSCVFYFHRVLCLQRAAATTLLLRRHGIAAEMIVGVKQFPFRSHAWVEVENDIVNDKPYLRDIYQELGRC